MLATDMLIVLSLGVAVTTLFRFAPTWVSVALLGAAAIAATVAGHAFDRSYYGLAAVCVGALAAWFGRWSAER